MQSVKEAAAFCKEDAWCLCRVLTAFRIPLIPQLTDAVNEPAIFQGASEGLINVLAVGVV